jgi:DUF4097 and DUF4098 domain-containing protein YvlB
MKRGTRISMTVLMAGIVWASGVMAGTPINESSKVAADAMVTIENLIGPVTVTGWNKNEVQVKGTLGDGPKRLDFDVDGDEVSIEVIWPDRDEHEGWNLRNPEETVLEINVPVGASVTVEGVNTEIEVLAVEGELELASVNGNITVTGDPAGIEAGTVNGDIEIDSGSKEIEAETVNGELRITGARGEFSGATVNGDIHIEGDLEGGSEFASVSGDIHFTGDLLGRGPFEFEAHSGNIILNLSGGISARFEIETFSGDIENDFGQKAERTSEYGPGMELSFETGGGKARVDVSSFSGAVKIRKK